MKIMYFYERKYINMAIHDLLKQFSPDKKNMLLILEAIQANSEHNFINQDDIKEVAEYLNTGFSNVLGVAKYFSMLNTQSRGKFIISICSSPVCYTQKSCNIRLALSDLIGIDKNETSPDGMFSLESVECLGHCNIAPAIMINNEVYGNLTPERIKDIISYVQKNNSLPAPYQADTIVKKTNHEFLLKHAVADKPHTFDEYRKTDGFNAFEKILKRNSKEIIQEIIFSGLRGRGGAGFPTGTKWKFTAEYDAPQKYAICNADEGEPGTFKDRPIMEMLPFLHIEGLMIASYCIGATKAYIYIRGEYTKSIKVTRDAIAILYQTGWLGQNIKNSGFNLDIEIFTGAGSYLCGDELTLIESLEGKRGNPRYKPPFPAEKGLFGMPTLVNNVETLSNIPLILNIGSEVYCKLGTETSPGTKIFCISGDVEKPGYYEAELGVPLSTLLYEYAGGIINGNKPGAILIGGAAGTFVALSDIDNVCMEYDELVSKNYVLGSGAIMVFDENKSMYDILYSILKFFKHESCGKCVPCRVGCVQLLQLMKTLQKSENKKAVFEKMIEEAVFMAGTSLCALGQSPILPLKSAFTHYFNRF